MRILLTTEGTYPFVRGGVSTWTHSLVTGLPRHEFTVLALVANPVSERVYPVPPQVALLTCPLWGSELAEEHLPLRAGLRRRRRTTSSAVETSFLPVLAKLLDQILVAVGDPAEIAGSVTELARFSARYDLCRAMHDERAWALMLERFTGNPLYLHTNLGEAVDLARSLYRYLLPATAPVPEVDIVHASAAAFCVFPGLVAKLDRGTPLVVSEHGIYLRERILDLVRHDVHTLGKAMFSNLYRGIGHAAYHYADLVAPVCEYNTRWEHQLGVDPAKIRVVHNGVDPERFLPAQRLADGERHLADDTGSPRRHEDGTGALTVGYVGRLDPLKDVLTLVRAARLVHEAMPDVRFRIHGPTSDADYERRCRHSAAAAGLGGVMSFEGPTDDPASAYRESDVVVLASMSEGFPFSVVEAMMCARPVVATAVGGVAEALDDPSLLAEPQDAPSLAAALLAQLARPRAEREALGRRLRQRALSRFTRERFLAAHDQLYEEVAARAG